MNVQVQYSGSLERHADNSILSQTRWKSVNARPYQKFWDGNDEVRAGPT